MPVSSAIARYGLSAIGVGAGIEGEPFALAGGVFAHGGAFPLWLAIVTSILGAFAIDQSWFLFSRGMRGHRLVEAMTRRPAFARSLRHIERRQTGFILAFRFAYGIRAVAPVALGLSVVRYWRYFALNLLSACVWGAVFTLIGYAFGAPIESWYARTSSTTLALLTALVVACSVAALLVSLKSRPA